MLPDKGQIYINRLEGKCFYNKLPQEYKGLYEQKKKIKTPFFVTPMVYINKGNIRANLFTSSGEEGNENPIERLSIFPENRKVNPEYYIGENYPVRIELGQMNIYGFVIAYGTTGDFSFIGIDKSFNIKRDMSLLSLQLISETTIRIKKKEVKNETK